VIGLLKGKRVFFGGVASKFLVPVFLLLFLLSVLLLWRGYENTYKDVYDDRVKAVQDMVDFTWGILDYWNGKASKGEISREDAQKMAGDVIFMLRYEGDNYIFGYDMENKVSIPFQSHERGKFLDVKDQDGNWVQRDLREIAKTKGKGFYTYNWLNSNTKRVEPKVAYVRYFEPFDWWYGTGVYVEDIKAKALRSTMVQAGILGVSILMICISIALLTRRFITAPLRRVVLLSERAGSGDLTVNRNDFAYSGKDEIGLMADALSSMISNQAKTVRGIVGTVSEVSSAAENLSALSEETEASLEEMQKFLAQVGEMTESGAAAAEEANAGVAEVAEGAQSVSRSATTGAEAGSQADSIVKGTVDQFESVIANVARVEKQGEANMQAVSSLASSVQEITGFVVTISRIADQTNLLALNAAIEAARAGEAGRGFAVVADEVRKLAEESNEAAKAIRVLINGLEEKAGTSVQSIESSDKILKETSALSQRSMEELRKGMGAVQRVISVISDLAAVSEEQSASSSEMTRAVDQIARTTSSIAGTVDTIRASSAETVQASMQIAEQATKLADRASVLQSMIAEFRV
jgi:methyl-accepting chemotaxis protein